MCQGDKLLAQFGQLRFNQSEAPGKVQERSLYTQDEAALEEQVDPLVCEQAGSHNYISLSSRQPAAHPLPGSLTGEGGGSEFRVSSSLGYSVTEPPKYSRLVSIRVCTQETEAGGKPVRPA